MGYKEKKSLKDHLDNSRNILNQENGIYIKYWRISLS